MARLHLRGKEKGLDKETIHVLNKKRESGNDLEKRLSTEYLEKEFVKGRNGAMHIEFHNANTQKILDFNRNKT